MIRDLSDPRAAVAIQRHGSYWRNEDRDGGDPLWRRPLFMITQAQPMADSPESHVQEPPPLLDVAAFRDEIERDYDQHGLMTDDFIRGIATGVTSEALVGCRPVVRNGTVWAEPCFVDWHQFDDYRVQETIWYQRLMENTRRALGAVDTAKYPFGCMGTRGPVDMAAAIMTAERLVEAVIDHPRELKNLLARITDIIIETTLAHSALIPFYQGGQFNSWPFWTPGRAAHFSVDSACIFSPACYEEFFLPCDQRFCEAFETPFLHLHASARQHFAAWTEIPNLGLQCSIDQAQLENGQNLPIGPQLSELLPAFKAIRARKSLMIHGFWSEDLLDRALAELSPGGSSILAIVKDPEAIRQKYLRPRVEEIQK